MAYNGESADEFYGITCPDDLIKAHDDEGEYDPDCYPNGGNREIVDALEEAGRE